MRVRPSRRHNSRISSKVAEAVMVWTESNGLATRESVRFWASITRLMSDRSVLDSSPVLDWIKALSSSRLAKRRLLRARSPVTQRSPCANRPTRNTAGDSIQWMAAKTGSSNRQSLLGMR